MFIISPSNSKVVPVENVCDRQMPDADGTTNELTKGLVVKQDFINTTENIKEIAVVFSRMYFLEEDDYEVDIAIELLDGSKSLAKQLFVANDIPDQHRVYVTLDTPLSGYVGKELTLKIYEVSKSDTGVMLMKSENYPDSTYKFGSKKCNGSICFSISGE